MNPYPLRSCEHCRDMFQPRTGANKLCSTCVPENDLRARQLYSYYKLCRLCYDAKLDEQGYVCAICSIWPPTAVDHDHRCCEGWKSCGNCVRGLLCHGCNLNLGKYEIGEVETQIEEVERYLLDYAV